MKVLVTGATGFLGSHLIHSLIESGHKVRVLVRPTSDCSKLQAYNIEIIKGDLLDKNSLIEAVKDQDIVFNNAGKVDDWGKREEFYRVNVDGTRNLLEASLFSGIKRFVHTSSITVLGIPHNNALIDETAPYAKSYFEHYTETKILSEKLVLDYYYKKNIPITIIRPGIIWGPGDTTIFPRLARLARKGIIFNIGKGTNNLCLSYISNVVNGILLSVNSQQAEGQIYHITDDENITSKIFFAEIAKAIGAQAPTLSIPFSLLYAMAFVLETGAKILKRPEPPFVTRYGVCLFGCNQNIDNSKAKKQLGYGAGVSFREGMNKVAEWYRKRGIRD